MSRLTFLRKRRLGRLGQQSGNSEQPLMLPGLAAWFDASQEYDQSLPSGRSLATLPDQTRQGNDYGQAVVLREPTLFLGWSLSCRPGYQFIRIQQRYVTNATLAFTATQAWTLVCHLSPGVTSNPNPAFWQSDGLRGLWSQRGAAAAAQVSFTDENGNHDLAASTTGQQTQAFVFDPAAGTIQFWRNAVLVSTTVWTPVAFSPQVWGRDGTAGANYGSQIWGEVSWYRGALDQYALVPLMTWFGLKWQTQCPP